MGLHYATATVPASSQVADPTSTSSHILRCLLGSTDILGDINIIQGKVLHVRFKKNKNQHYTKHLY